MRPSRLRAPAVLAGALLAGSLFLGGSAFASPQSPLVGQFVPAIQSVTSYVVKPGDTLYGIGSQLGVPASDLQSWIKDVVSLSGIKDPDLLDVGEQLSLPSEATGESGSAAGTTGSTSAPAGVYLVNDGDTLLGIAFRQGIAVSEFVDWTKRVVDLNKLTDPDRLTVGQSLHLPSKSSAPTSPSTSSPATQPPQSKPGQVISYTVQDGDTLTGIAAKGAVPDSAVNDWVKQVRDLNKLDNPDILRVGAVLQIPLPAGAVAGTTGNGDGSAADVSKPAESGASGGGAQASSPAPAAGASYVVQAGDTLYGIAAKQGVKEELLPRWVFDVQALNPSLDPDRLSVGQKLLLPDTDPARPRLPGAITPAAPTGNAGATPSPTPKPSPTSTASPPPLTGTNCFYTVVDGDTWAGVVLKLAIPSANAEDWEQKVRELNGLTGDYLPVGDGLRIPCS